MIARVPWLFLTDDNQVSNWQFTIWELEVGDREQKWFIGQIWVSVAVSMINILPRTVIGVCTLFMYAAIISLRTDLFLFCFPNKVIKGEFLSIQDLPITSFK